jgi:hypothetical protein
MLSLDVIVTNRMQKLVYLYFISADNKEICKFVFCNKVGGAEYLFQ